MIKQTGDGFFAAFDTPGGGGRSRGRSATRRSRRTTGSRPDVRIGLHAGEAFSKDEVDFGGQGVHAAARIGALAGAGEIVASAETLAHGAVSYGVSEPRSAELKGISEPVEVVSIDWR